MMELNRLPVVFVSLFLLSVSSVCAQPQSTVKRIHETFLDAQNKNKYPVEVITALSGEWLFNDALVTDVKSSDIRPKAPRLLGPRSTNNANGFISTGFDIKGLTTIKVGFIGYKDDISDYFAVEVFVSKDGGKNWASLGIRRGDPTKEEETFAEYKIKNKKQEAYRVKIANASQPKSDRLSRINITEIQFEYEEQ